MIMRMPVRYPFRYQFENGGTIELMIAGDVSTEAAIAAIQKILSVKQCELDELSGKPFTAAIGPTDGL